MIVRKGSAQAGIGVECRFGPRPQRPHAADPNRARLRRNARGAQERPRCDPRRRLGIGRGARDRRAWPARAELLLIVLAHVGDVNDFRDDVAGFAGVVPEVFPLWENAAKDRRPDLEVFGKRLRLLRQWADADHQPPARFVVASLQALMQPVPTAESIRSMSRTVRVGETLRVEELAAWLLDRGMIRVEVVEVAGEFSLRGGILDVFPADAAEPFRIEFFGDDIESIRPFDPETQRSLGRRDSLSLTPLTMFESSDLGHVADALPKGTWVALIEPNDLREEGRNHLARLEDASGIFDVETTFAKLCRKPSIAVSTLASASLETTCNLRVESVERFSGELARESGTRRGVKRRSRVDRLS